MILQTNALLTATTCTDADAAPRIVEGLILPWNQHGMTSAGDYQVARGAITIPDDLRHIKLLRNHSTQADWQPVGYALELTDTDAGLYAKFHLARTPDGDLASADIREGVRDALSVELLEPQFDGDTITAATLMSVALVAIPAFSSARVTSITASHTTPDSTETTTMNNDTPTAETVTASAGPAAAPGGIHATPRPVELSCSAIYDALARLDDPTAEPTMLTAALQSLQVAKSPLGLAPNWVGELWEGVTYQRKFIPAMRQDTLTGLKMQGVRWKTKPEVADYAGHPAEVSSTKAEFELVEVEATRLAGANQLPIEHIHFHQVDVIAKYFAAMAESYAQKSDEKALADALAGADAEDDQSAKQWSLFKACGWARHTIHAATNIDPDVYVVNDMDWFNLIDVKEKELPAFLEMLGITPAQMKPTPLIGKGKVLAWCKPAIRHGELAGSPIRVDALNVAKGATDEGVFGYRATLVEQPKGLKLVKFTA